ncbi:MAG: metalloprotease TldD [Rickettsiales bacterium]|nr:metalloprotease TldD [Rickettsiales bacterium]
MDQTKVQGLVDESLHGMDDGELFLEFRQSENLLFDDGQLKNASYTTDQGFGLRSVLGETTGYAFASDLSEAAIKRAQSTVRAINMGQGNVETNIAPAFGTNRQLYSEINPLEEIAFEEKLKAIEAIEAYVRAKDPRVAQVTVSLAGNWQAVQIMREGGQRTGDIRPLVRLNINVVCKKGDRMESGSSGAGGRVSYSEYLTEKNWKAQADEALRQALVNLDSRPAPAGEMPVVLGPGWPGVLLHEAVGHGLEGDFNRKKTSLFSSMMGERVASKGVTVIDDGTFQDRRGSISIDDEGTPSAENVLIEDGILKGYMQDRMNARLMGVAATGNGRREDYGSQPMPRMTNTFMRAGDKDPAEIIASVDKGLYAVNFSGGQVDITSGKFVFSASEAYMIENGKITHPVKGATLIGNGPDVMQKVKMIGNDLQMDNGIGTCGKAGQSVPVGIGQPTLLIDPLTVGGTEAA